MGIVATLVILIVSFVISDCYLLKRGLCEFPVLDASDVVMKKNSLSGNFT